MVIGMQVNYYDIVNKSNIIDIRIAKEFNEYNLGFKNIPKFVLLRNPDKYLNKNDEYYLLCDSGKISLSCAMILNALGYHCYSITGGLDEINKKTKN